jgi:hypothetical protein
MATEKNKNTMMLTAKEQIYKDLRMEWARRTKKVILKGHDALYKSKTAYPINYSLFSILNTLGFSSIYLRVLAIERKDTSVEEFISSIIELAKEKGLEV